MATAAGGRDDFRFSGRNFRAAFLSRFMFIGAARARERERR